MVIKYLVLAFVYKKDKNIDYILISLMLEMWENYSNIGRNIYKWIFIHNFQMDILNFIKNILVNMIICLYIYYLIGRN